MVKAVSASWLAQRVAQENVVLLDVRSSDAFNSQGYIAGAINVSCTGILLRRLKKGNISVESLLNDKEDKRKYETSKQSESVPVVVCDCSSASTDSLAQDSLAALVLKRASRECKFVAFLSGGYCEFRSNYGEHCVTSCSARRPSSLVLQLNGLGLDSPAVEPSSSSSSASSHSSSSSSPGSCSPSVKDSPYMVLPHLYLGSRKAASSLRVLSQSGIRCVLNVTPSEPNRFQHVEGFTYKQIAVEDSHDVNIVERMPEAFQFIEQARAAGEKILVHCHAGMSRSVSVVLAYLIKYYGYSLDGAYDYVKERKADIQPNFSFMGQLLEFEYAVRPPPVNSPADSGISSCVASPVDGCCFLSQLPSPVDSRQCILAA